MSETRSDEDIIRSFYQAFARRDAEAMVALYSPEVEFSDPVFPNLRGDEAKDMWRMLCHRGKDLEILLGDVWAEAGQGGAHWEAIYTFSGTGRKVHNRIDAQMRLEDGLIVRHVDAFDLWRWAGMALGAKGRLLGWLPPVRRAVQRQAAASLRAFRSQS